jgi:DNA replication and repair protein RecF
MFIKTLYIKSFRSYLETEFLFSPGINLIVGDNAQGKTNLLEALHLLSTGRSFRSHHLSDLIRYGDPFFYLEAVIHKEGIDQTIKLSSDGENKRLQIEGSSYSAFQPLLGYLPSVLYAPDDKDLISGSPAERRRFFNLALAQADPLYVHHLARFSRALKQRNFLLRHPRKEGIESWESEMALAAAYLSAAREAFLTDLTAPLSEFSQQLTAAKEKVELRYVPSAPLDSAAYLKQLTKNRPREIALGATLTGPHRDDFLLLVEEKPARLFASEGQKNSAIAALRLAERELLSRRTEQPVLFSIDDLGLHLDAQRTQRLASTLATLGQVFITTPAAPPSLSQGTVHLILGSREV